MCSTVVSYFTGTFQDDNYPNQEFDAQFQFRLNANPTDQRVHLLIDGWNNSHSNIYDFAIEFYYGQQYP